MTPKIPALSPKVHAVEITNPAFFRRMRKEGWRR
jgi:hypothetical protein